MKFKPGVVMWRMHPWIEATLSKIDEVCLEVTGREATITSAREGEHSATSLHYQGAAVDVRTHHLTDGEIASVRAALADALGPDFDVVLEPTHIHIEYDPE